MYLARKNIGIPLDRQNRNNHNDNYKELYGVVNNLVDTITDEVYEQIIDGAKLNWKSPVDSENDLPTSANEGDTVMTRDDGKVYRYDGSQWQEIQQIDAGPVNELDSRLTSQLADDRRSTSHADTINTLSNYKDPKFMFSFIDDDGQIGVYDKLYPIFKAREVPLTAAISTGFIDNDSRYMTTEQLKELHRNGMEIMSHTHSHIPNKEESETITEEELKEDYLKARNYLLKHGFNHRGHVYPYNRRSPMIEKVAREVFDYAFSQWDRDNRAEMFEPPINNINLRRYSIDHFNSDINEIKSYIDEAKHKNEWLVLYGHVDQESWWDNLGAEFVEEILDYVISEGGEIVTTEEGMRHHGNLMEIDRLNSIDKYGNTHGRRIQFTHLPRYDEFIASTLIEDYTEGTTIQAVRNESSEGLPEGAGIVITHKAYRDYFWSKQFYYPINSSIMMVRRPGDGGWSSWQLVGNYLSAFNEYTADSKPSDFHRGSTITRIQASESDGLPNDRPGLLTTIRPSGSSWATQTYVEYAKGIQYTRSEVDGDDWSEWQSGSNVFVETKSSEYSNNAPITDFEKNKITYVKITSGNASGYGLPESGILEVHRDSEDAYSFQKYTPRILRGTVPILYRNIDADTGEWNSWRNALGEEF